MSNGLPRFEMYGFKFPVKWGAELAIKILTNIIPYFPLIYLLGLLPQCNTLIMYIMEQINIHAFGSSGKILRKFLRNSEKSRKIQKKILRITYFIFIFYLFILLLSFLFQVTPMGSYKK